MVLSDELFEWFYDQAFPPMVHLANVSGGTDIVSFSFSFLASPLSFVAPWLFLVLGAGVRGYEFCILATA